MKYKKIICSLIFSVICIQLISCSSIMNRIEKNLENDKYSVAIKEILVLKDEDDKKKADSIVLNKAEEIKSRFVEKKIDGTLAIADLQKLKTITGVSEDVKTIIDEVQELNNSRKAYLNGIRYENEQNYKESLESYFLVSANDNENYENAKASVERLKSNLKNEEKIEIINTNILKSIKSGSRYSNTIQMILKNKSELDIKSVNVTIIAKDAAGKRAEFNTVDGYDTFFYGALQDINIKKGTVWGNEFSWSLKSDKKLNTIESCIQSIVYSDGTEWANPLYNIWLEENRTK